VFFVGISKEALQIAGRTKLREPPALGSVTLNPFLDELEVTGEDIFTTKADKPNQIANIVYYHEAWSANSCFFFGLLLFIFVSGLGTTPPIP